MSVWSVNSCTDLFVGSFYQSGTVFSCFLYWKDWYFIFLWYSLARVFDLIKVLLKNLFSYDLRSRNAFDLEFKQNYLSINLVGSLKPHVLKLRAWSYPPLTTLTYYKLKVNPSIRLNVAYLILTFINISVPHQSYGTHSSTRYVLL